jgi:3-isopropylmalate/(R)-2-methylmalate dehydratase small subunit
MTTLDSVIKKVSGRAVAVPGDDIDTDRIMPARYLKCVTFEKIGQYTFQDERFAPDGKMKDHPFNDPARAGASILVVNKNFGCGSSREHAPQGIHRWGVNAVVGESFAEIFAGNCAAIGMPAVTASEKGVRALQSFVAAHPEAEVVLDLEGKTLSFDGKSVPVEMKEASRKLFLEGSWDSTATLLSALEGVQKTGNSLPYIRWTGV